MFTDWLYQGAFTLQRTMKDPNQLPTACILHALTGPRQDGSDGEPAHLFIIDTPLPLPLPRIAEQLVAFFHINPKDSVHQFLMHTPPGGALLRHVFVQFLAEWEQQKDGSWLVPQPGFGGTRHWRDVHVTAAKEPEYTALLRPPVRLTLHLLDPLADGGPFSYGEVYDGVRLVWNARGACLLLSGKEAPNYVTIIGGYVPCFATPHDAFRFLQESQLPIFPSRALSQSIVSLVATPVEAFTEAEEASVPPLQEQNDGEEQAFTQALPLQEKETETTVRIQENTTVSSGRPSQRGKRRGSQASE